MTSATHFVQRGVSSLLLAVSSLATPLARRQVTWHDVQFNFQEIIVKHKIATCLIATCALFMGATATFNAQAQSEVSALSAVSAMPLASVVVGVSTVAGSVVAIPVALSTAGAVLVVKVVEVSARGTVYLLERASDGVQVSVEVLGKGAAAVSVGVGTVVTVSVIGAGVLLSAAGEVIAFIPNELGKALMHNERVTQ